MEAEKIAAVCYEANRAYRKGLGESVIPVWSVSGKFTQEALTNEVKYLIEHPTTTVEKLHDRWVEIKFADGWQLDGPNMVEWKDLPAEQRGKIRLFRAVVGSLAELIEEWTIKTNESALRNVVRRFIGINAVGEYDFETNEPELYQSMVDALADAGEDTLPTEQSNDDAKTVTHQSFARLMTAAEKSIEGWEGDEPNGIPELRDAVHECRKLSGAVAFDQREAAPMPNLAEILGELAGTASLCWDPKPEGVFDGTQAKKWVDEAGRKIVEAYYRMGAPIPSSIPLVGSIARKQGRLVFFFPSGMDEDRVAIYVGDDDMRADVEQLADSGLFQLIRGAFTGEANSFGEAIFNVQKLVVLPRHALRTIVPATEVVKNLRDQVERLEGQMTFDLASLKADAVLADDPEADDTLSCDAIERITNAARGVGISYEVIEKHGVDWTDLVGQIDARSYPKESYAVLLKYAERADTSQASVMDTEREEAISAIESAAKDAGFSEEDIENQKTWTDVVRMVVQRSDRIRRLPPTGEEHPHGRIPPIGDALTGQIVENTRETLANMAPGIATAHQTGRPAVRRTHVKPIAIIPLDDWKRMRDDPEHQQTFGGKFLIHVVHDGETTEQAMKHERERGLDPHLWTSDVFK